MRRRTFFSGSYEDPIEPKENYIKIVYDNLTVGEEYLYFTESFDLSQVERIEYYNNGSYIETEVSKIHE